MDTSVNAPAGSEPDAEPAERPERRRALIDLRPLQESSAFRRLWFTQALSAIGSVITSVAVVVQIYSITSSSLAVGMVGVTQAVPLVLFGLFGGSIVDAVDRRKLAALTSGLLLVVAVAFAAQAVVGLREVWLLYLLTTLQATLTAVDAPAVRTFMVKLVRRELIPSASALSQLSFQLSMITGALLGGVLVASAGLTTAYLIDTVTFVVAFYGIVKLPVMPLEDGGASPGLHAVLAGLRFVRRHPLVGTVLLADINATVLGMPVALFPAIVAQRFGGDSATLVLQEQ